MVSSLLLSFQILVTPSFYSWVRGPTTYSQFSSHLNITLWHFRLPYALSLPCTLLVIATSFQTDVIRLKSVINGNKLAPFEAPRPPPDRQSPRHVANIVTKTYHQKPYETGDLLKNLNITRLATRLYCFKSSVPDSWKQANFFLHIRFLCAIYISFFSSSSIMTFGKIFTSFTISALKLLFDLALAQDI